MSTFGAIPSNLDPAAGQSIRVNGTNTGWEVYTPSSGSSAPAALGQYITGNFYDLRIGRSSSALVNGTVTADIMQLVPFIPPANLSIDQIGVVVTTIGGNAKVIVYDSNSNGWPNNLIRETGNLSMATATTYANEAWSFTFNANTKYWVGFRASAGGALRRLSTDNANYLGNASSTSASAFDGLSRTLAFATGAPSTWSFVTTDLAGIQNPVTPVFRAA